jgi:hypothetical protein
VEPALEPGRPGGGLDGREPDRLSRAAAQPGVVHRAVLGEELWITERPRDKAMAVNAAASVAGVTALAAARKRRPAPAAVAITAQMALTLGYWRLMAEYYERSQRDRDLPGK